MGFRRQYAKIADPIQNQTVIVYHFNPHVDFIAAFIK